MKLDEFVSNVLKDIDKGLQQAKETTDRDYSLQTSQSSGVDFDIAVTTTYTSDLKAEGKAKVGIVEVLGAGVGATINDKNEKSEVSRVKFCIYVPPSTQKESEEHERQMKAINEENANKFGRGYY